MRLITHTFIIFKTPWGRFELIWFALICFYLNRILLNKVSWNSPWKIKPLHCQLKWISNWKGNVQNLLLNARIPVLLRLNGVGGCSGKVFASFIKSITVEVSVTVLEVERGWKLREQSPHGPWFRPKEGTSFPAVAYVWTNAHRQLFIQARDPRPW